jgi:hypothetical protein
MATGGPVHSESAVSVNCLYNADHHPDLKHDEVASEQHRCPPECNKVEKRLDNMRVLGADASDVAPFVVLPMDQPKKLLVVQEAVSPVEECLVEEIEQRQMSEEFTEAGNPGDSAALLDPRDIDQGHHSGKEQMTSKNLDDSASIKRGWRFFSIIDATVGKPSPLVSEAPEGP